MADWTTLRAKFPEEEFEEIERISKKYKISYNEIIRSGVKFYIGLTLAKEVFAETSYGKDIKIRGKNLADNQSYPYEIPDRFEFFKAEF